MKITPEQQALMDRLAEYNLPVRGVDDYVRRHFPSAILI